MRDTMGTAKGKTARKAPDKAVRKAPPRTATPRESRATTADIARRAGLSYEAGQRFLDAIVDELNLDREVHLTGFGTFRITTLRGGTIDRPVLSAPATIPPTRVIRFKSSRVASDKVNGGRK